MPERPLWKRLWWDFIKTASRLGFVLLFRIRVSGREQEPLDGPVLICSNHQSHLDPVIIGLSLRRRLNYLARKSLFKFAPFRWLIDSLEAIPIDRDGSGLEGLKETLRRLKRGRAVVIFPEGTRTPDGELGPLKPGFLAVARRGKAALLPLGIAGAFDAWPRQRAWPRPRPIAVKVGSIITAEQVANLSDDELLEQLRQQMQHCHNQAQRRLTPHC